MNRRGIVEPLASLEGSLTAISTLQGEVSGDAKSLSGELSTHPKVPVYVGDYEVTPKANDDQILETKDKLMNDNITVFKVPRYDTTNLGGGLTVFIAEE